MKSSHRSFDRPNVELGLIKKARVTDESNRNEERLVSQQQQQQQQHDELIIIKYKRALAELTINSKPIITNLTIIAGENLRSAKAITAVICGNILEIPSEQKLPSLYLLDSIVKNIGRDYIKYFSARLPEVFCKAYREVKPLVHPGMRRLFGTWRRVFPPQQLQLIEKELGFTAGINGSSSGTPRDDSQAQQPADSMLVNRKYLDARRYLQQPTRANGSADDIIPTDIEKPDRAASVGSGSSWVDLPTKRVHDNTINAAYRDPEYGSDLSRGSGFGSKIKGEKLKEEGFDKSWYNSVNGKSRRNGLDMKHGFQSISQKTAKSDAYPQLTHSFANRSTLMDRSWQNSEEEEYMWDDVNSVGKDRWAPEDSNKPRLDNQLPRPQSIQEVRWKADSEASSDSLSTEDKGQASTGDQMSSMWLDGATHSSSVRSTPDHPRGYQTSFSGLSTATSSIARKPFQSQKHSIHVGTLSFGSEKTAVESRGPIIQPREAHRAATPSSQSPMRQLPPSPSVSTSNPNQAVNSVTKEYQAQIESHADTRISQFSRGSNLEPHNQFPQESLSTTSQSAHLVNSQIPQTPTDNPSSLMSSLQEEYHVPFPQKIQRESPESSGYAQKAVVTQISGFADPSGTVPSSPPGSESPGQTSMSSLLAAIMKSGVFGSKSSVAKSVNSWDKEALLSQAGAQPLLPSGPPIQWSSGPKLPPVSVANEQFDRNASNPPNYPERNVERPQLLPGPPTLVGNVSLQASDVSNANSNPVTKLLSSLVAKGLVTASKELSPTSTPSQTPPQTEVLGPPPASISSTPVVSAPVSLPIPFSSPNDELSLSKPAAKIPDALLPSTEKERKNLAGFEFKPGVIRESNPCVISELLDDVPYQCGICGLRLKHQVRLDRHLEWHTFRYPDGKLLHSERRWYLNSEEWISGTGSLPSSSILAGPVEGSSKLSECTEMMVPADEGQCICVLCGQLFEDHYDEESCTWMFKGAVYMNNSSSESGTQSHIVHKNCISESSDNLRLTKDIKPELET